jgi:hypothetical protein
MINSHSKNERSMAKGVAGTGTIMRLEANVSRCSCEIILPSNAAFNDL